MTMPRSSRPRTTARPVGCGISTSSSAASASPFTATSARSTACSQNARRPYPEHRRPARTGLRVRSMGRAHFRLALAAVLSVVTAPARGQGVDPTAAVPDALRTHLRSERFAPLTTVAALPASLRDELNNLFGGKTLEMADPGAPFQATDVMVTPRLPPDGSSPPAAPRTIASSTTSEAGSPTSTTPCCSRSPRMGRASSSGGPPRVGWPVSRW